MSAGMDKDSIGTPSRPEDIIQLQVGERRFTTTKETLMTGSTYFASFLSGRWATAQPDGSYFVNADPGLFEHILRYLRRPSAPPIFYDVATGHNFALYNALLEEAKYFGIGGLIDYLQKREYINWVQVNRSIEEVAKGSVSITSGSRVEYHAQWVTERVYVCPRGIIEHRGDPTKCGRRCDSALDDGLEEYEDETSMRVMAVTTSVYIWNP